MGKSRILCFLTIVGSFAFGFFATYGTAMPCNGEEIIHQGEEQIPYEAGENILEEEEFTELPNHIAYECEPGDNSKRCLTKRDMTQMEEDKKKRPSTRRIPEIFCSLGVSLPTEDCKCVNGLWECSSVDLLRKRRSTGSRLRRETPLTAELKNTPCAPNDYFKIDCNTCYCKIDRTGYLCTENISCEENIESSTTTHIPMSDGNMLIISDHGAQLIKKDSNNNDNNLSRNPKSLIEADHTSPIRSENGLIGNNLEASTSPASAIAKH